MKMIPDFIEKSFRAAYGQRGGVIATNFIVNETGATVTINGLRYREKIHDFLLPDLDDIDLTALRAAQATKPSIFEGKNFFEYQNNTSY